MSKLISCPTCNTSHTAEEWNSTTQQIVTSLNGTEEEILSIGERIEGALYRCPNERCQDEVITLRNLELATITEEIEEKYLTNSLGEVRKPTGESQSRLRR